MKTNQELKNAALAALISASDADKKKEQQNTAHKISSRFIALFSCSGYLSLLKKSAR